MVAAAVDDMQDVRVEEKGYDSDFPASGPHSRVDIRL